MTFALMLGFFRNNFGFGGNNGLTDFKDILGFNVQADGTRNALLFISCLALAISFLICRAVVYVEIRQGAGRDPRCGNPHPFPRLSRRSLQAVRLHAVGLHGGRRRRALCAAGRHHQSRRIRPGQLHRGRDLGRGRRPWHADRRGARRLRRQLRQDLLHLRRAGAVLAVHARQPVHPRHAAAAARHHRHLRPLAGVAAREKRGADAAAAAPHAAE